MKSCRICKIKKPLDEYHRRKSADDGRQARCKICAKRISLDHYYRNKGKRKPQPVQSKACTQCGTVKAAAEFFSRSASVDGLQPCCKECDSRVRSQRYDENWDREKENRQRYSSNPQQKKKSLESNRKYRQRNPQKTSAHNAVNNALRDGKIVRPDSCSDCGLATRDLEAHHEDYSRPLDVKWLCTRCHGKRHRKMSSMENSL